MKKQIILFLISLISCFNSFCYSQQYEKTDSKISNRQLVDTDQLKFKSWLKDTCIALNKFHRVPYSNDETNKSVIISEDSLSLEIRELIHKTISKNDHFSPNSIIGSALSAIKYEKIVLPKTPFIVRIAYSELYEPSSHNLKYEETYEYAFFSITPVGTRKETVYSIIKGNIVGIKKRITTNNWIPKEWK